MKKTLNILYLEDEANLEEVVTFYLQKQGIAVHIQRVTNRHQFESAIAALDHDLVIVDRLLEDIDGIEAISLIRKRNKFIPIIMLSGTLDEALVDKALAVGANDYVLKQHIERLGPSVQKVLHHAEKTQQRETSHSNEDDFLNILQHLPGGVYQLRRNQAGRYSLPCISIQFQNMLGVADEEVKHDATPVFEKVHPDDLPGLIESIGESALSLNKWDFEFRIKNPYGEYFWTKGLSTPQLQDDGSILWAGILLDINHQKQTEKALRHSEISVRAILDNLVETFYRTDAEGRLCMVSSSVKNLLGYSHDELLGKKLSDFYIDPQQREEFLLTLQQKDGSLAGYEAPLRHKDGRTIWVSTSSRYYYDEKGDIAGVEGITRNITDKHNQEIQTHNKLQITSERLGHLLSNLPTILYSLDITDNQFIPNWVSNNILNVTGYSIDEALSKDWWISHLHPDDKQRAINNMELLFENGTYTHEYRFQCKDGNYKWFLDRLILVADDNGVPVRINGSWNDVTDQRHIKDQLRENEERLRRSQGFANIGTWDWNIKTGDLYWSERIGPLFGYEEGKLETTYDNFLAAVHPDDRQSVIDAVNNCVKNGADYNVEHRTVWPDGSIRWLLEKGDVTRDKDGSPLHMLGVVQDITERKQAEQALQESQAKLSGLFNLSPLGIALTDMDGRFLDFNQSFQKICAYPADELMTLDYWLLTPCEYEAQEQQQLESLNTTGRYGPYEKVYRQKNGNLIPVRLNGILIKDKYGQQQIWSIVENITDSKQAEQALIEARDEAERANQAKSQFLSSMSHELRTPLNAILGFSQLLELDESLTADQIESITEIRHAGEHLLELINDILDLSKIESGRIEMNMRAVNLLEIINESIRINQSAASRHGVSLSTESFAGHNALHVIADKTRLKQVIINLLSNAIKYNKRNGSVAVSYDKIANNHVKVHIQDTGKGFSKAQQLKLFVPFERLGAESSNIEGTGIGLVITKTLIEHMGGEISVQSAPEEGSTFSFTLAMAEA